MVFYNFHHLELTGYLNIDSYLESQSQPLLEQPHHGRDQQDDDEGLHGADFDNVDRAFYVRE